MRTNDPRAIAAMRALRDVGTIRASVRNDAYVSLGRAGLVYTKPYDVATRLYRLTSYGRAVAAQLGRNHA